MTRETMITILTIALFVAVAAIWMILERKKQKKWFLAKVRRMWGSVTEREYSTEELESISHYARRHQGERFLVDDITWNDLNMDQIFINMNTTVSSCGEDVLYAMLRLPEFDRETLEERNRLIEYFRIHQKEREEIQMLVQEVRKISSMSLSDYIFALKDVEQKGVGKYIFLACLTLGGIGSIFVQPLAGALLLLVILCFNGYVHMKDSRKIEPYLNCFLCILRLLKAADGFSKMENPEIQSYLERMEKARKKFQGFRRGAFLVTSTNGMQDGLEAFVLSYLKIMFQVDMIKFYSMLKGVYGHEKDIDALFTVMGELDALIVWLLSGNICRITRFRNFGKTRKGAAENRFLSV